MAAEEQGRGVKKGQAEEKAEEPAEELGYAAAQLVVYICACGCLPAYIYECAWVCVALCKAKHALSVALFGRGHKIITRLATKFILLSKPAHTQQQTPPTHTHNLLEQVYKIVSRSVDVLARAAEQSRAASGQCKCPVRNFRRLFSVAWSATLSELK